MATKVVNGKVKLNIYSSFTLSNDDVASLSLLYTPLMGSDALSLYLSFASLLERNNLKSESLTHQDYYDTYSINPADFMRARIKLEGIGLLETYANEEECTYVLCSPLTPKGFLKDGTLGLYLYSIVGKDRYNLLKKHFEIEKIEKANFENVTKTFDEVFTTQTDKDITFEKFKYILGKKPNKNISIRNYKFDFDMFAKNIEKSFLDVGITTEFKKQVMNLAFVYAFNEIEMEKLYNDSIGKNGQYSYKMLKNNAFKLFVYKRNMDGPKLVVKNDEIVENHDLINWLDTCTAVELLDENYDNYPEKYLDTINEIYSEVELPRGVVNCMILKVMKEKFGELPTVKYFTKMAQSWIRDSIFSTADAVKYVTTAEASSGENKTNSIFDDNGGFEEL